MKFITNLFKKSENKIFINGYASTPLVPSYPLSNSERVIGIIICLMCLKGLCVMATGQNGSEDLRRSNFVNVSNVVPTQKAVQREDMVRRTLVSAKPFHVVLDWQTTLGNIKKIEGGTEIIYTSEDNMLSFGTSNSDTISSYEVLKSHETKDKVLLSCSSGTFTIYKEYGKIVRCDFVSNESSFWIRYSETAD